MPTIYIISGTIVWLFFMAILAIRIIAGHKERKDKEREHRND